MGRELIRLAHQLLKALLLLGLLKNDNSGQLLKTAKAHTLRASYLREDVIECALRGRVPGRGVAG